MKLYIITSMELSVCSPHKLDPNWLLLDVLISCSILALISPFSQLCPLKMLKILVILSLLKTAAMPQAMFTKQEHV